MDDIFDKWGEILDNACREHDITPVSFDTWLKPLKPHHIEDNKVYITVSEENGNMAIDYLNKKYKLPLQVAIGEFLNKPCEVIFVLPKDIEEEDTRLPNAANIHPNLNSRYTFDNFVVGSNSRFAYNASLAVAESPGEIYNPLFLYGGVGLGKTHLMHAIAHFILDKNPNANVLYVTSEVFTNELIESIRHGNNTAAMSKFREKYRNVDALLIDDIQFIIGKESTQEEFFHTFNHLHLLKKQIIISSDKPPKDLERLEERLKTRFEMGLIADISSPDYETRMAILRKKEEIDGYKIPEDVVDYIATNVKSNIRELEGALNKLIAYSFLEKQDITLEVAENELKDLIFPDSPKKITPELIIKVVSEHFSIRPEDICSHKRNSDIVYPRQIVMYLCRELIDGCSLKNIGSILGGRDHATIIHGANKIASSVKTDERTANVVEIIKKKLTPMQSILFMWINDVNKPLIICGQLFFVIFVELQNFHWWINTSFFTFYFFWFTYFLNLKILDLFNKFPLINKSTGSIITTTNLYILYYAFLNP